MGNLLLGALARRDVFDGGNPATALQRPVDDLDRPAARRFRELAGAFAERHVTYDRIAECIDIAVKGPGLFAVLDQPVHGAAWLGHIRRQSKHLDIGLVADDDRRRCIIKHKALRDIVHGDAEVTPLRRQPLIGQSIAPQQQTDDYGENGDNGKQYAFANVPVPDRDADRNCRDEQDAAKREPPDRSGLFNRTRRHAAWRMMAAVETHLVFGFHFADHVRRHRYA